MSVKSYLTQFKSKSNTLISEVYFDVLKKEYDELINKGEIRITDIRYNVKDKQHRNNIYIKFYHYSTYRLLKMFIGDIPMKPIIYFEDFKIIQKINDEILQIIPSYKWDKLINLLEDIDEKIWECISINSITKELRSEGYELPIKRKLTYKTLKDLWKTYSENSDDDELFKLNTTKTYFSNEVEKIINRYSEKLKWGGKSMYYYFQPKDSYIIEFYGDGCGIMYDSIYQLKQTKSNSNHILLNKQQMDELYYKVEKHRLKLYNRINSYCGWKTKQMSFHRYRNGYLKYDIIDRIIRYMIVKEYDLDKWVFPKLYSDLLYRGLINSIELLEFKNQYELYKIDFKFRIKNQLQLLLKKYDYRSKPNVFSVDLNKYFRMRNKYKQFLQL